MSGMWKKPQALRNKLNPEWIVWLTDDQTSEHIHVTDGRRAPMPTMADQWEPASEDERDVLRRTNS
ncbi:hypothetical protein [Herbiconiux daphne]|uniref:Uncharacterized protein n=1 Tax=Herbiconiux daphne TaxID=2970914 RepID=A0ABT2GYJ4_9MICO|nr:hypothetical protein [Herbiconiux daphne]MCS5732387.1 hypothetical protein [Herbiconiux daphne]